VKRKGCRVGVVGAGMGVGVEWKNGVYQGLDDLSRPNDDDDGDHDDDDEVVHTRCKRWCNPTCFIPLTLCCLLSLAAPLFFC
jgi:hypothetical protein